jgi:predicted GIY-YIG superfamily endonuclease
MSRAGTARVDQCIECETNGPPENPVKECKNCGELKPLSSFSSSHARRISSRCDECRSPRPYQVYALELRSRCKKNRQGAKPCVYVGCTQLTPEERLAKHRQGGITAAASSKRLGVVELRWDLFDHIDPIASKEAAYKREIQLRKELLAKDFCVHEGKGGDPFDRLKELGRRR